MLLKTSYGRNVTDGNPMPENLSDAAYDNMRFFISPLIQGCDPIRVNIVSMDGVYTEFVQDGTLYRLTECSNIEIFADRTVYLCVSDPDKSFALTENYFNVMDEETGQNKQFYIRTPIDWEYIDALK